MWIAVSITFIILIAMMDSIFREQQRLAETGYQGGMEWPER